MFVDRTGFESQQGQPGGSVRGLSGHALSLTAHTRETDTEVFRQ